ncbi:unnamed protein product [Euphydryas editha]|uniref:Uncharacterized protein n=1 Tax=Euphydryas editha TaxID=104508 RepID=A0AAU9UZB6_EUPED|nr:unnamed protein product [Euphydryas editha]
MNVANIAASGESRNREWLTHTAATSRCVHTCTLTHSEQRARRIAAPLASRSGRSAAVRALNLERSALQTTPHAIT